MSLEFFNYYDIPIRKAVCWAQLHTYQELYNFLQTRLPKVILDVHVGLTPLSCLWEQEIVLVVKRGKKLVSNVATLCTITANQKLEMERSNRAVKVSIKNK